MNLLIEKNKQEVNHDMKITVSYFLSIQWQLHRACESGGDDAGRLERWLAGPGRGRSEQGGGVPPPATGAGTCAGLQQLPVPHPWWAAAGQTGKTHTHMMMMKSIQKSFKEKR